MQFYARWSVCDRVQEVPRKVPTARSRVGRELPRLNQNISRILKQCPDEVELYAILKESSSALTKQLEAAQTRFAVFTLCDALASMPKRKAGD